MSLNPETIIRKVELGTSRLNQRIMALNAMCDAGYPVRLWSLFSANETLVGT